MEDLEGYTCSCCGKWMVGLPFDYAYGEPYYWRSDLQGDPTSYLTSDVCVIEGRDYFLRGSVEVPVIGSNQRFAWGIWVSLAKKNFDRAMELLDREERVAEPPYFGWFSNQVDVYPDTLNLKTSVSARSLNERFYVELEPTNHPLSLEQRNGMTLARVREIAEKAARH
jgi:hypothetical protein